MESKYDCKFEEMKKYIPFLESMIVKLQDSHSGSNPRQAQLDKIRSLRDLLMDKKKRMKMENLLKCEQVLINLYAKVNERNAIPVPTKQDCLKTDAKDLTVVRSKLKSVVSKLQPETDDTLPEIARASETEEKCVPGSKEPALFQRRPNISSTSSRLSPSRSKETTVAKRTYTRVLLSPEPSDSYWSKETTSEQQLFSRRSPKPSPRKRSPTHYRKERRKSLKSKSKYNESQDLNITLNVPEDSLNSLNTKDILSRIINCSDNDVDIATLRELRTQILGELKDTGTNDDISDIILKSYKNKNKQSNNKGTKEKLPVKSEVEEGELSDSESEAIESIYGSLVVVDKNKTGATGSKSSDKDIPRKIQICLVINSEKTKLNVQEGKDSCVDASDFETFNKYKDKQSNELSVQEVYLTNEQTDNSKVQVYDTKSSQDSNLDEGNTDKSISGIEIEDPKKADIEDDSDESDPKEIKKSANVCENESVKKVEIIKTNIYKPLELDHGITNNTASESENINTSPKSDTIVCDITSKETEDVKIPLLEPTEPVLEPSTEVSEIDILQALKKEILSETNNVLNTDTTSPTLNTPLLHQPKISKVADAKEIGPKKRISIESYKAKVPVTRNTKDFKNTVKDDPSRKQSLKLTEKECERFNFLSKLTLTESSDDEDKSSLSLDDIYTDLAPKSPDHEDFADTGLRPPVIIPSDPVQTRVVGSEADVDMRKLLPNVTSSEASDLNSLLEVEKLKPPNVDKDISKIDEKVAPPLVDPRVKRDSTSISNTNILNSLSGNVDNVLSPLPNFITTASAMQNLSDEQTVVLNSNRSSMATPLLQSMNVTTNVNVSSNIPPLLPNLTPNRTPNLAPNMTPNLIPNIPPLMTPSRTPLIGNMTPSRVQNLVNMTPNMTPSRHTFDSEDISSNKHVYAPMFYVSESGENMDSSRENQTLWEERNPRNCSLTKAIDYRETRKDIDYSDQILQRDIDYRRSHSVQRDVDLRDTDYRDTKNNSVQSGHTFDRESDRIPYPPTPSHPFGRRDCPPTPTSSFGRRDCPPTPTPSFGRVDRPMTPSHPFGRSDCPLTPSHPFGRSDCPLTPSHPFGRNEPLLPTPGFGRPDYNQSAPRSQDPRMNRTSDYESYQYRDDDRDRGYYQERPFNSRQYNSDPYNSRNYHREQSVGRNDKNKSNYRDQIHRRETSLSRSFNREDRDYGRSFSRENESDRYMRYRNKRGRVYDYRGRDDSKRYDESYRRTYQREKSVGRSQEPFSNSNKDRNFSKSSEENKLHVSSRGGTSFTIDTSVNRSFQEVNNRPKCSSSFDARRQRALSVGRSLQPVNKISIHESNHTENKIRNAKNFRRACSVGREVDSSKKLDFKDIKADLRSFKFNSDFRFTKDTKHEISRLSNETTKTDSRKIVDEIYDKSNSKYSPRKNNRDPRMRRDHSRDTKETSISRDSKSYGIVYSNDNISKGTILGSGYGVKNYKIPKIKRIQEVSEVLAKNDNVACNKNESDSNVNLISNCDMKEKAEKNLEEKNNSTSQKSQDSHKLRDSAYDKLSNEENKHQHETIEQLDEIDNRKKVTKNRKPQNLQITENHDKNRISDDVNIKITTINNEPDINIINTSLDSMDGTERRVTRSARKNMSHESLSLELSPIKRTRKVKKTLVLESDSDDNEKISKTDKSEKASPQMSTSVTESKVSSNLSSSFVVMENKQIDIITQKDTQSTVLVDHEERKDNAETKVVNNENQTVVTSKNELDFKSKEEKKIKQVEDDLDSSFSLGDLEMFTDNITADTVVDNINALIADLDHDLDSSKNNEANSHFTNEISLETMLENISSPDKCDNRVKETVNVTSIDVYEQTNKSIQEQKNIIKSDSNTCERYEIPIPQIRENKVEKLGAENSELSPNVNEIQVKTIMLDSKNKEKSNLQLCAPLVEKNKVNVEDTSNDAIVSTSDDGNNITPVILQIKTPDNDVTGNSPSTPDSTINNVENLESSSEVPANNESGCEMNSDISSTLATDAPSKGAEPSNTGKAVEIDTILSILKDKGKMKELLSLLDTQSNENEKIKKKLEKLSEIVSDDESVVEDNHVTELNDSKNTDQIQDVPEIPDFVAKKNPNDAEFSLSFEHTQEIKQIENNREKLNENKDCLEGNAKAVTEVNKKSVERPCGEIFTTEGDNMPSEISNSAQDNLAKSDITEIGGSKVEVSGECDDTENKQQDMVPDSNEPIKKKKRRRGKKCTQKKKKTIIEEKRVTRSNDLQPLTLSDKPVTKKPSRELLKLQEDIREMFIKEDVLGATGIRMCRLAKLVDEKKTKEGVLSSENTEPLVVLEKCSDFSTTENKSDLDKIQKKKLTKTNNKDIAGNDLNVEARNTSKLENNPIIRSKNKLKEKEPSSSDPYDFETDSVSEMNKATVKNDNSSESESDSINSTKSSESADLAEIKKKVKRRRGKLWQSGVIKPKNRKKKSDQKLLPIPESKTCKLPDFTCFTDKNYCFRKIISTYNCRICSYTGADIVHHYKKNHPHTEVPLSRLSPAIAKEAIKESEDINFQAISKISSKKYVCRFCFKEFSRKGRLLEAFFWHVVSMHTGEYKQTCPTCVDTQICPLDIDIPPPPKDANGQLLGYICEKCNYTQISLENLKTHVIVWHNDEQTAVYTINLASLSKSAKNNLINHSEIIDSKKPRLLRSSRTTQCMAEFSENDSDSTEVSTENITERIDQKSSSPIAETMLKTTHIQSKITFESDITDEISNYDISGATVKIESDTNDLQDSHFDEPHLLPEQQVDESGTDAVIDKHNEITVPHDIFDYSHFKIKLTESGSKEYVCCVNGNDNHYKTSLLISMKKHVQLKHTEKWDGYCCLCKAIVTPQGEHNFKDCLQHFLDKHLDNFPIFDEITITEKVIPVINEPDVSGKGEETLRACTPYINVRPLSDLISEPKESQQKDDNGPVLPIIESVMSLGQVEQPLPSPSYPTPITSKVKSIKQYKYEEYQAEIMSRKHLVVLEAMMVQKKLVQVFKCAGRFCSFTTDSAEDALLHASTHMKIGGIDALNCAYCDYDPSSNAIDLITHVFKYHGCCPYVCGMCFYRAAATQLVKAHIHRVHDKAPNVEMLKSSFQTQPISEDNILLREAAVPYYICDKSTPDGDKCKYRTYTSGKFRDHLFARHPTSTEFLCFICSISVSTPLDLTNHLETSHGLKLYQCSWCVFGAEDEKELLNHASAVHPNLLPKAYLRIITNKEGTNELRVLPLAHLNKSILPFVDVPPNTVKDFPVREAERSIELEKLIGHMLESVATTETNDSEIELSDQVDTAQPPDVSSLQYILQNTETLLPRVTTPVPTAKLSDQSEQCTPILKTETLQLTPEKTPHPEPEIVCLDSDDETPPVIASVTKPSGSQINNLNTVEIEFKKVDQTKLFICAKCKHTVKYAAGFKKHLNSCFSRPREYIPCVHCNVRFTQKQIITHYNTHLEKDNTTNEITRYYCNKCSLGFVNLSKAKEHHECIHSTAISEPSLPTFIKKIAPGPKSRRKRCLDTMEKSDEPPEKVTRYGPQDIDKLPINPILDDVVTCLLCEFNTKVRVNMVRHLQLHAQQQPVPQTAPVNPVPHLKSNEMHFDKMLNLASSSIGTRSAEKINKPDATTSLVTIPPEAVSVYPMYVPDKQRLSCGAKGCSYISVDESMLKCHWETLHYDTIDFHCVHCPPHQHLDKSKPLSSLRVITHLKMHDDTLYACSLCTYYHFRIEMIEKHLTDIHKGGQVMIVREGKMGDANAPSAANASISKTPAPTMDLKPWQCGLCKMKSMLRQEVVDHCAKVHNSKMQYKCAYCAFRTSNPENITKHRAKSHADKPEEIFYFYYREGTVPDEPDGTTRWQKQSQNTTASEPKVKSEVPSDPLPSSSTPPPKSHSLLRKLVTAVDLNLVKKEHEPAQETIEDLCREFGQFCEPNGLKYKCSLCSNVIEDSSEAMQSHLYEELKYRKWGCSICSYKAFHREGLSEHMQTEHRERRDPIALPVDNRVETWVSKLLEHQTSLITKYKENFAKQKVEILRSTPGTSIQKPQPQQAKEILNTTATTDFPNEAELEKIFGPFGASSNRSFCCPKCNSSFEEEDLMHSHLESELNKIRWFCSNCAMKYQSYHEAQFHCRSAHVGQGARPVEATREASVRAAWIGTVIKTQKQSMNIAPAPKSTNQVENNSEPAENSLLVVRYEERIPTPDQVMVRKTLVRYEERIPTPEQVMVRKTSASAADSDDERLVIDEPLENRKAKPSHKCPHCTYTTIMEKILRDHILRHYGLKKFNCPYCDLNGARKAIEKHQKMYHPTKPIHLAPAAIPSESPSEYNKKFSSSPTEPAAKVVCLVCRNCFSEGEALNHVHEKILTTFGKKGEVVVQCSICHTLHKDITAYLRHHKMIHPELGVNYVFIKLNTMSAESKEMLYACNQCSQKFSYLRDLKTHYDSQHPQSAFSYTIVPKHPKVSLIDLEDFEGQNSLKRKCDDEAILPPTKKSTARKSTTKLPLSSTARKSTTKLPFGVRCETEEYSYYGAQPATEGLEKVVTMMPFCNKMVPFTFSSLKDMINIDPVVLIDKSKTPL